MLVLKDTQMTQETFVMTELLILEFRIESFLKTKLDSKCVICLKKKRG